MESAWTRDFRHDPRHSGIFLDFDGTISEIAPTPGGAVLHHRAAELLPGLARHYPLCVISGRRAADLASLVGLPHIHYVGIHGMEWLEGGELRLDPEVLPHLPALDRARKELREALPGLPGVILEDKLASLTLHYREAPGMGREATRLAEGLALKLGLHVKRGRKSVELRPPVEIDKGTVIIRLARGWRLRRGLFAGDDLTDVDGFRGLRYLMREGGFEGVAVAVLSGETPVELEAVADITVSGPEGLLDLLAGLVLD